MLRISPRSLRAAASIQSAPDNACRSNRSADKISKAKPLVVMPLVVMLVVPMVVVPMRERPIEPRPVKSRPMMSMVAVIRPEDRKRAKELGVIVSAVVAM